MVLVALVVGVCHHPLVDPEDATWFEDAEDLRVDGFEGRGVDGCFDGVGCVEGGGGEVDFLEGRVSKSVRLLTTTTRATINEETHHEVTPHKPDPLLQLFPHSMRRRPLHLIRIVI